jgi:hypothetical protein
MADLKFKKLSSLPSKMFYVGLRQPVEQFAVMSESRRLMRDAERSQGYLARMTEVEKYMRVCLGIKEGFESVVTVAASEPILREAVAAAKHFAMARIG